MDSLTLAPSSALGGIDRNYDGLRLQELTDLALVSAAIPRGGAEPFAASIETAYAAELPAVGRVTWSGDGHIRLLGLQPGLLFILYEDQNGEIGPFARDHVADALGNVGYTTDQSDSWVALRLSGPASRRALQYLCPLDLHPDRFPEDAVARTVMEHLGVIIIAEGPEGFLLLSARSSANSLLHAVDAAIVQAASAAT